MNNKWLIYFFLTSILTACSGAVMPVPTPAVTARRDVSCVTEDWSLEFHRSGGFAGFDESLTLNSDGELSVDSNNPQAEFHRTLPKDDLNHIVDQLEAACPFEAVSIQDDCADCFSYTLTIHTNSQIIRYQATDVNLTEDLSILTSTLQSYFNEPK